MKIDLKIILYKLDIFNSCYIFNSINKNNCISKIRFFFNIFHFYYYIIIFFIVEKFEKFDIVIKKARMTFIFINNVLF